MLVSCLLPRRSHDESTAALLLRLPSQRLATARSAARAARRRPGAERHPRTVTDAYTDARDTLADLLPTCFLHFVLLDVSLRVTDPWVAALCPWPVDTRWAGAFIRMADCQPPTLRLVLETNRSAPLEFAVSADVRLRVARGEKVQTPAEFYAHVKRTRAAIVVHGGPGTGDSASRIVKSHEDWYLHDYSKSSIPRLPYTTVFCGAAETRDTAFASMHAALCRLRFPCVLEKPPLDRTVYLSPDGLWTLGWMAYAEHRWPHAAQYVRDVAMALHSTGLGVYPLMWVLDWLPGMLQWREISKMRTIDRTLASIRRVLAARPSPVK
jgi:hypothetical protein